MRAASSQSAVSDKMRADVQQQRQKIQEKALSIESYRAMLTSLQAQLATTDKDYVEIQANLTKVTNLEAQDAPLTEEETTLVTKRPNLESMRSSSRADHKALTLDLVSAQKALARMEKEYGTMHAEYQAKLRWTNEMLAMDVDVEMTDLTGQPSTPATVANSVALKTSGTARKAITTELVGGNLQVPTLEQQDLIYRTPQAIMKDIVAMLQFPVGLEVRALR